MTQPRVIVYSASDVGRVAAVDEANTFTETNTYSGIVDFNASVQFAYVAKTADYTATALDYTIAVTCSSADITITLPTAVGITGRTYNIKKMDATAYTVIIDGAGTETIDGDTAKAIATQYDSLQIQSTGAGWVVI